MPPKKVATKKPAARFLKRARTTACYRYPASTKSKTKGRIRPTVDRETQKEKPKKTYLRCKRKLRTPAEKKSSAYNRWDTATARPSIGAKRPKNQAVRTTKRNARKGQY